LQKNLELIRISYSPPLSYEFARCSCAARTSSRTLLARCSCAVRTSANSPANYATRPSVLPCSPPRSLILSLFISPAPIPNSVCYSCVLNRPRVGQHSKREADSRTPCPWEPISETGKASLARGRPWPSEGGWCETSHAPSRWCRVHDTPYPR
jgi:hypothetical protein